MFTKYADDELKNFLQQENEQHPDRPNNLNMDVRPKFKYVDGVERLGDMLLPFLVDLPNGSSEAVFLINSIKKCCVWCSPYA